MHKSSQMDSLHSGNLSSAGDTTTSMTSEDMGKNISSVSAAHTTAAAVLHKRSIRLEAENRKGQKKNCCNAAGEGR